MTKYFREPIVHFLILGSALFCAYSWKNAGRPQNEKEIRISANEVRWMEQTWTKQFQRKPSREEMRGIVADYLREQLLAREAQQMGLDKDDVYVRRRLAQKLQFLIEDTAQLADPQQKDLEAYYRQHVDKFTESPKISFEQVYFAEARPSDAARALARLNNGADETGLGESTLLNKDFHDESEVSLASQLGPNFASAVFAIKDARWNGPIRSSYGYHLVRVKAKVMPILKTFNSVRAQVRSAWIEDHQREANKKYFAGLLKRYVVVVDESVRPLVGTFNEAEAIQ